MTTSIVVGGILLAAHQQLRVEELAVAAGADLVNGRGVEVDKQSSGNVLAIARLGEESLKRAAFASVGGVGVGTAIEAQTVLEAVAEMNGLAWP